jgi:hypothetical protein
MFHNGYHPAVSDTSEAHANYSNNEAMSSIIHNVRGIQTINALLVATSPVKPISIRTTHYRARNRNRREPCNAW